jgi:hypothetical protein
MTDRQMIEELLHRLCIALPYVEDAQYDESYKPETVKQRINLIKTTIQTTQQHIGEKT